MPNRKADALKKDFLTLPERDAKPRKKGLTIVLDSGAPLSLFRDTIESFSSLIDMVKFGWGTALVTPVFEEKLVCLKKCGIDFFLGGTLFEKSLHQNQIADYRDFCLRIGARYVEISDGTIEIDNAEKAKYVEQFAADFMVLSEVGYKDVTRSLELSPTQWVENILQDLDAGAHKVILESRESGESGICRGDGELRYGLISDILGSPIPGESLIFEAPNKYLQTQFVQRVGSGVNLANIALDDIIPLETLRLGLRSDTFFQFDKES